MYSRVLVVSFFIICFSACTLSKGKNSYTNEEERILSVVGNSNFFFNGKLRGISGKSLKSINLEDIISTSKKYNSNTSKQFREIINNSIDVKIYGRVTEYVMCFRHKTLYICDVSSCGKVEYYSREPIELLDLSSLFCK